MWNYQTIIDQFYGLLFWISWCSNNVMITGCVSWSPGGRDMGRHLQRILRQPHSQHHAASQQSSQLSRGPGRGEDHSGRTINKSHSDKKYKYCLFDPVLCSLQMCVENQLSLYSVTWSGSCLQSAEFQETVYNNVHFLNSTKLDIVNYQEFVEPAVIDQAGYILIALGAFIFIISFLGYCGSIKESRVLLTAYGIFLIIIFCLEVRYIISLNCTCSRVTL